MNGDELYRLKVSPARADAAERKRSALAGVKLACILRDDAGKRFARERERLAEAVVAARDAGCTVAEIADAWGVTRAAVYQFISRERRPTR